jgi:hypothetical protein
MSLTNEDKQWIEAQLERLETKLLTEFQKWASPNAARQRRFSSELHEFELQLENHEDRLQKLEGKQ